jgi:uroporphyrinogen-III decarboxylase
MTSRQRVLTALEHREPDRIPVDLGGTIMTGIAVRALIDLRKHLHLETRAVKAYEVFQMLGEVEADMVEAFELDVLPVEPEVLFFGLKRSSYKPWALFDGTEILVPENFEVEGDGSGGWLLREGGDPSKPVVARIPEGGYYFDRARDESLHTQFEPPPLKQMGEEYGYLFSDEQLGFMVRRADELRPLNKAHVFGAWPVFGPPRPGNMTDWLCLLVTEPEYVGRLFEMKLESDLKRLEQIADALGDSIDIFGIDGNDYGTQRSEMFSPEVFERFYLPYYRAINGWIHENTDWKTWKHTCGSVPELLPLFIESGLDAINPVQTSASGMEPQTLKERYGERISFWGGGVDTQRTLPFETPETVYDQVAERIRTFGPGGGFVFAAVHNIQAKTPPQNIEAMFQAIRDHGAYPLTR